MYTHRRFVERDHAAPVTAAPPLTHEPARRRGARPFELGLPIAQGSLVLALIVVALLLRALIAGILLPRSGFQTDVGDFAAWASRLAAVGPGNFYQAGYFSDYPPGYMYILWGLGLIGKAVQPIVGLDISGGLVKIPAILADAGTAWLLYLFARRFLGRWAGDTAGGRIGLVASAVYLLNPGVIFDSAVWGQVDSVGALAIVATLYLLARGWTEGAAITSVIALLLKFQFAFLIPIVALVGLKRHLFGRSSDPELDGRPDVLRVLTSLAAGLGTLVLLIVPFGLSVWSPDPAAQTLVRRFLQATETYHGVSISAFNLWMNPWSQLADPRTQGGLTPSLYWGCDVPLPPDCPQGTGIAFMVGSFAVTWQLVGMVLFLAVAAVAAWALIRRDDATGLVMGTLLVAVAFFVLPTRVHERYLFPALALGALLVLRDRRWAVIFGLLSLSFFANIYGVYTADWSFVQSVANPGLNGQAMARDPLLAATLLAPWGIYLLSAMIVAVLGWLLVLTVGAARGVPVVGDWRLREAPWTDAAGVVPATVQPPEPANPAAAGVPQTDAGQGRASVWLPAWLRVDRWHPLFRDPFRRLDRLDLALVIVFFFVALGYRAWRIDIPRSMCCFDEIYHARSAIEFLSDWEHGWTRDVYEWTHPMLAKYLIAAGIEIADPNKVTTTTTISTSAPAMAVAPRRSSMGFSRSIVFLADGNAVVARDALSGEQVASWNAGGPVASLTYDEDRQRLLVGLATSGELRAYDLSAFLAVGGERAPPQATASLASGLASADQILAPAGANVIVVRGSNGLATLEPQTGAVLATSDVVVPQVGYAAASSGETSATVVATVPADRLVIGLDATTLAEKGSARVKLDQAPLGPILVQGSPGSEQVWVPVGDLPKTDEHPATSAGVTVLSATGLMQISTVPLPGRADIIGWQSQANLVFATGKDASGTPTMWAINPDGDSRSGFATFDSTTLPATATALAFDVSNHAQADDDGRVLLATADGGGAALVGVDTTSDPAAWRLMGIIFGSLLVVLVYLLAATMFRRRGVAILAAAFVTIDGMAYTMSRMAMNDIYVAVFIVAAYLVFWQIWSGRWARSAWWALPLVGILIGLAAATKWVGWYALIGLWVLVLARSALGRFLLVAGIAFITVVLGLGAPWPFLAVSAVALLIALFFVYVRPIQLDPPDLMAIPASGVVLGGIGLAFAIGYKQVPGRNPAGAIEILFDFLARGTQAAWPAWLMLGVAAVLIAWRAVVSLTRPESDRHWMRPRELAGFGWPWIFACLVTLPLLVYFVAYIPYLQLGHSVSIPGGPGYGWSLDELQVQMFSYHFGLTAGHPSASPWWSWPLDIKPVWFYGSPYDWDGRLAANVYNNGNFVLFWAGIPALLAAALLAWRRRSAALVLIVAAFAFQFLPWTRIERATFQYHYLAAVPFAMIAVAYLVDEALRSRLNQAYAITFLVAVAVVGIVIWPMSSAFPMPDWYVNAAKSLPPWNFYFQFPNPPSGPREALIDVNTAKLVAGSVLAVVAVAFATWGQGWLVGGFWPRGSLAGAGAEGGDQQQDPNDDQDRRPQVEVAHDRDVVARQEPGAGQDEERSEDQASLS